MKIEEIASALEKAYFNEGYQKLFGLDNDLVIAVVSYGDDKNVTIQLCDENGNTHDIIYEFPADIVKEPLNFDRIARKLNAYLRGKGFKIAYSFEWDNDESEMSEFDKFYNETVKTIAIPKRRFEFTLQKLNENRTKSLDEFKSVVEYSETGNEAFEKVINANPGWRVYSWGEFSEPNCEINETEDDEDKENSLSWSVNFEVLKDGEEVDFFDMDEVDQEYILSQIKEGYNNGLV